MQMDETLKTALTDWQEHFTHARGASAHSVIAYRHDIEDFLGFIAQHRGEQIGFETLAELH